MRYILDEQQCRNLAVSKSREWLLTNGLGGYAMGTPCGANTRRYHGLLVAATVPPATRYVLLAGIDAFVQSGLSNPVGISTNQYPGAIYPDGYLYLKHFHVDQEAVWIYHASELDIEHSVRIHDEVNAVTIEYSNIGERAFTLTLRPFVSHKSYHANFNETPGYPQELSFPKDETVVTNDGIALHLSHPAAERTPVQGWYYRFEHEEEIARGLDPRDDLYCPCELKYTLAPGQSAILVASTDKAEKPKPRPTPERRTIRLTEMLRDAASKFIVKTSSRTSIIAGYPWFADWGRDTMISLPGLLLHTGRVADARELLLDYAGSIQDGLIPNRFTEAGGADYNTADASLWFVHAIYKTLELEWDEKFAKAIYPTVQSLIEAHQKGSRYGIHVDPDDGLLSQGEPGLQLTWMDAKIGDWVVTPRHGKPVEVCGLWINALRAAEWLSAKLGVDPKGYAKAASKAEASFEEKFWHEARGHYFDTVDPMDVSLRPNQVIAMALPFSPAKGERALRALKTVEQHLLTPYGLRTLGPEEPGYRGRYQGPLAEMDASYHQGTVWPWLLGPYCTALARLTGDKQEVKRILKNARQMLNECGLSGISEVYDGSEPQTPGGCPWQAWSVAEIFRSWVEDAGGD
jgi:glycogen debranching enzyme